MGKNGNNQLLPVAAQRSNGGASRTFLCRRCSMGICALINLRCVVFLIFSVAAFLSAVFFILPIRYRQAGFDAKESIKLSASVQAHFKLQKPVSELVPYISRLEYDITGEIGIPFSKIAVLSMHPAKVSNWTDVVFGFLPDPISSTISSVYLMVLKSSLVELYLQESNLTLTSSIFGEPSYFEILKFPGGITIIPEIGATAPQIPQVLFNFTLNSTINDIKDNLPELKEQLKLELHLMPTEVLYIQVTNKHGSTKDAPVTVEASVASDLGMLLPERLRQLAQIITGSPPTENLGLDHSVFGKVKEISLSSFLNHSINTPAPTATPSPAPAPAPELINDFVPSASPSYSPASSPNYDDSLSPCSNCYTSAPSGASQPLAPSPHHSLSPKPSSAAPSVAPGSPHCGSTDPQSPSPTSHPRQMSPTVPPRAAIESPLAASPPQISPSLSPSHGVVHGSRDPKERSGIGVVSPPQVSPFTSSGSSCSRRVQRLYLTGLATFLLLYLISWMSSAT